MQVLLDTHVWVWSLWNDPKLSQPARDIAARAEAVFVSPISFYEVGQKVRIGKWPEVAPFVPDLRDRLQMQGGQVATLTAEIALLASELDWSHRDPFDRIIAATALRSGMVLVSADVMFDTLGQGGLQRVW